MSIIQGGVSLWLSDWSDKTIEPEERKPVRLSVYASLGIAQCILFI